MIPVFASALTAALLQLSGALPQGITPDQAALRIQELLAPGEAAPRLGSFGVEHNDLSFTPGSVTVTVFGVAEEREETVGGWYLNGYSAPREDLTPAEVRYRARDGALAVRLRCKRDAGACFGAVGASAQFPMLAEDNPLHTVNHVVVWSGYDPQDAAEIDVLMEIWRRGEERSAPAHD